MKHSVVFQNADTDWNEALPMGNGVFGCMSYFKDNCLKIAYNHYEVYYTENYRYSGKFKEEVKKETDSVSTEAYQNLVEKSKHSIRDNTKEPYIKYQHVIWPSTSKPARARKNNGASYPPTGELDIVLSDVLKEADETQLRLNIEDAETILRIRKNRDKIQITSKIMKECDTGITEIDQSRKDEIQSIILTYPQNRNHLGFEYHLDCKDKNTFYCHVHFYPKGEDKERFAPFEFVFLVRLIGADGYGVVEDNMLKIDLQNAEEKITLISYVLTKAQSENPFEEAFLNIDDIECGRKSYQRLHEQYWKDYFKKCRIRIPDHFLETLWYLNLYVLGCCSGLGGKRYEQASGLNGLWDIKKPTIWGSMWYWDVNIQASYWPVYAVNHLELAEAFNDGFLSFSDMAERRAKEFYDMDGYAIDYPHTFYNCIGPWCAQYLWWYYEYSLDKEFLRDKAYPMFKKQIAFLNSVLRFNQRKQEYEIFPDISPEQGPITKNSTITISCIKYLLKIAIAANRLLDHSEKEEKLFFSMLDHMPKYATCHLDQYGEVLKDSEYAPPGIPLRHPSLLMPIFPVSEINKYSDKKIRKLGENTLHFAEDNTELGVFGFGWLSCAASRLGKGTAALRLLYEKGIDLILRANGMGAEETDRWVNHCCVGKPPYYYPFMMECVGEVIAAVNEMLMQSYNGIITVFPALPDGDSEEYRQACQPVSRRGTYGPWEDCSFARMLAKGGFEVSSVIRSKKVKFIKIHSLYGGTAKVRLAESLKNAGVYEDGHAISCQRQGNIVSFETMAEHEYLIANHLCDDITVVYDDCYTDDILVHSSHISRRVFIGKDENTDYVKKLDSFLFDYYIANERYRTILAYKFNFGVEAEETAKTSFGKGHAIGNAELELEPSFIKITAQDRYTRYRGFGFTNIEDLRAIDRQKVDMLRRDFIQGSKETEFRVELPKGRYDLLVVSGDPDEGSHIRIKSEGALVSDISLKFGRYAAEIIPVVHKEDGDIRLTFDTNSIWKVNLLIIKRIQVFL